MLNWRTKNLRKIQQIKLPEEKQTKPGSKSIDWDCKDKNQWMFSFSVYILEPVHI